MNIQVSFSVSHNKQVSFPRYAIQDTGEVGDMFSHLLISNSFYGVCVFALAFLMCLQSAKIICEKYMSGKIHPVRCRKSNRQKQRDRALMDIHETKLRPEQPIPRSVNYHFTRKCNYECGFCFHTAKTSYMLSIEDAKQGLLMLKNTGKSLFFILLFFI